MCKELENSLNEHKKLLKQYEDELKSLNKSFYSPILYNYIEFDEISNTGLEVMELIEDFQEDIKNKNNISGDLECLIKGLTKWKEELNTQFENKLEDDPELAYLLAKGIILRNKNELTIEEIKLNLKSEIESYYNALEVNKYKDSTHQQIYEEMISTVITEKTKELEKIENKLNSEGAM